jgi:hypothetical protein
MAAVEVEVGVDEVVGHFQAGFFERGKGSAGGSSLVLRVLQPASAWALLQGLPGRLKLGPTLAWSTRAQQAALVY